MSRFTGQWEDADAEAYIRELFTNVLGVDQPAETEVMAWKKRALQSTDPLAIFRAIIALPQQHQNIIARRDAATRWPPGHFYSPAISRRELSLDQERVFSDRELVGVDLQEEAQIALFPRLARYFDAIPFDNEQKAPFRYRYNNSSYNYGDAIIYWSMLNLLRPNRIIEIGSGFSSALALDTIDFMRLPTICTFVDPYPELANAVTAPLLPPHSIVPERVQTLSPSIMKQLGSGDILFIDSSHVLKAGSDVHFELTELLPRIPRGAIIHFHDVFTNFEYPKKWVIENSYGWNEQYGLHLFLMYNREFEIIYFNHYFARKFSNVIREHAPAQSSRILLNPGGGLWLRRL
jgi:hypothetical protein